MQGRAAAHAPASARVSGVRRAAWRSKQLQPRGVSWRSHAARPTTQQSTPPPDAPPPPAWLLAPEGSLDEDEDDDYEDDEEGEVSTVWISAEDEEAWAEIEGEEGDEPSTSGRGESKRLPAEVRCFDTARIYVQGGDGGKGCVAFRREAHVSKGGPSGGNGGRGGNVWVEGDASLNSLTCFRQQVHFRAAPGTPGQGSDMHGCAGKDAVVRVPPGTIIRRKGAADGEPPLAEVLRPGERVLLAAGGRGGRGNLAFKSGRNTAPALAELGETGEEMWLDLELRLVADVALVGVPNAGKSSLLRVLSAARPRVGAYPFTTLVPNLGVCQLDFRTTVFADVPGLLEGAHKGLGLGSEFLRHASRCRALLHVVDGSSPDPVGDYAAVRAELALWGGAELADMPEVVAYNKMDLPDSSDYWEDVRDQLVEMGVPRERIFAVSAASGQGVVDAVRGVRAVLDALPSDDLAGGLGAAAGGEDGPSGAAERRRWRRELAARRSEAQLGEFTVTAGPGVPRTWTVEGVALSRFAQMTDWNYYEAARRFQRVLDAAGVLRALRAQGVQEGDTVVVGEVEFDWSDDTSEGALYDRWLADRRAAGAVGKGQTRWPHATG